MTEGSKIVHDHWNAYAADRDGIRMFVSFDDAVTCGEPPRDLSLCARVMIPIQRPNNAGGPVSPESERLWDMEDALVLLLKEHRAHCRLVGRLT